MDKTGLISELLKTSAVKVTLFTRPRRFGKSLAMSMLANFFGIRKDSRGIFDRIAGKRASLEEMKNSLLLLTRLLQKHYGRQTILLLDEYDVPMAKASANGYYTEMPEVMRAMVGAAFKDNTALRMAVSTGCLRLARESIFTGANNFTGDTISDVRYQEYFGFTEEEVRKMAQDTGCVE